MSPITALKLLCAGIEALVKHAEEMPQEYALKFESKNNLSVEKPKTQEVIRKSSCEDLALLHQRSRTSSSSSENVVHIEELKFCNTPQDSPTTDHPIIIVGDNAEPLNIQHSAITRKFYSKYLPPIGLPDYLMRIHKFCPMSTAVYLSTSYYIQKLAVQEKALPVTRYNCHRLVLAGLRVAMKALEDHSYAHSRFSKVGGVTEAELARLEISFCFLTNFELKTSKETLLEHANNLKIISSVQGSMNPVSIASLKT
ncbi:hypothetical protein K3495_g8547 [Podosphaera aphanis]|nr:hypothetical protein K3495_g8547 [Podosphaera aphanis]